ncbi:hypothetical protein BAZSYMB_GCONTIG00653_1 [Bathymodiolus azoricus thioautotrophic gill symbiont]|uniref:Uncharacterized protein n=1 Tax=Bathymodiolus azoricus thioautotrophic gill symbiont TaxID=235205 RepID=A0A1H6LU31_9GAMM|nr:hypothetical protein BAZSYMB_GCONTIG00653_1 [Bathymodiolus azoricus thioautotrophic gill symbiont]
MWHTSLHCHDPFLCLFVPLRCHQAVDFLVFSVLPQ